MTGRAHVKLPSQATRGEIIQVKSKFRHPMETGWRKDASGNAVPRKRIHSLRCSLNGRTVFRAQFDAGISADPYLSFFTRATESGEYRIVWIEDGGAEFTASATIAVAD